MGNQWVGEGDLVGSAYSGELGVEVIFGLAVESLKSTGLVIVVAGRSSRYEWKC